MVTNKSALTTVICAWIWKLFFTSIFLLLSCLRFLLLLLLLLLLFVSQIQCSSWLLLPVFICQYLLKWIWMGRFFWFVNIVNVAFSGLARNIFLVKTKNNGLIYKLRLSFGHFVNSFIKMQNIFYSWAKLFLCFAIRMFQTNTHTHTHTNRAKILRLRLQLQNNILI